MHLVAWTCKLWCVKSSCPSAAGCWWLHYHSVVQNQRFLCQFLFFWGRWGIDWIHLGRIAVYLNVGWYLWNCRMSISIVPVLSSSKILTWLLSWCPKTRSTAESGILSFVLVSELFLLQALRLGIVGAIYPKPASKDMSCFGEEMWVNLTLRRLNFLVSRMKGSEHWLSGSTKADHNRKATRLQSGTRMGNIHSSHRAAWLTQLSAFLCIFDKTSNLQQVAKGSVLVLPTFRSKSVQQKWFEIQPFPRLIQVSWTCGAATWTCSRLLHQCFFFTPGFGDVTCGIHPPCHHVPGGAELGA